MKDCIVVVVGREGREGARCTAPKALLNTFMGVSGVRERQLLCCDLVSDKLSGG